MWGVTLLPKSPLWVFLALAGWAEQRRRAGTPPVVIEMGARASC